MDGSNDKYTTNQSTSLRKFCCIDDYHIYIIIYTIIHFLSRINSLLYSYPPKPAPPANIPVVKIVRPAEVDKNEAVAVNPATRAAVIAEVPPIRAVTEATPWTRVAAAGRRTGAMNEDDNQWRIPAIAQSAPVKTPVAAILNHFFLFYLVQ